METSSTQTQEKENRPEKVFQDIVEKRKQREQKGAPSIEEINDIIKDLSPTVATSLLKEADFLREHARDTVAFRELLSRETERTVSQYTVERFGMPSKMFAKEEVKHAIDALFSNSQSVNDFRKIARISVDLNGLKAVNDLNGGDHTKGDVFLEVVAKAIKDEKLVNDLTDRGITLIASSDGGDEFGLVLVSETPIEKETLGEIMGRVNENLSSEETSNEVRKVLDFNNEVVASSFLGITIKEWNAISAEEKESLIPKNFVFQAKASMGAVTLFEAFEKMSEEKNAMQEGDSYERIIDKLMGSVFTESDKVMQENKEEYKKGLHESEKPEEKFLSLVYSRNEGERKLAKELDVTKKELEVCLEGK